MQRYQVQVVVVVAFLSIQVSATGSKGGMISKRRGSKRESVLCLLSFLMPVSFEIVLESRFHDCRYYYYYFMVYFRDHSLPRPLMCHWVEFWKVHYCCCCCWT